MQFSPEYYVNQLSFMYDSRYLHTNFQNESLTFNLAKMHV